MSTPSHDDVSVPVFGAPMAGGPTTPELVAGVGAAGGLGFLAAGYLGVDALRDAIAATRRLGTAAFGVNVFVPGPDDADPASVETYAGVLKAEADRLGVTLGEPRWDDDSYPAKLDALVADPPHTVGFTFGLPGVDDVDRLHTAGARVAITVTSADEARAAADRGADLLVVQGTEAGGHQGTFDGSRNERPLHDTLATLRDVTTLPLVAAGGIMTADDAAAARRAGAHAVQLGTALLCTPQAGTSAVQRVALLERTFDATVLTRAFSGRWARGLANRLATQYAGVRGYPQLHHLTRPLRAAGTRAGDPDVPNLWAGTGWRAATTDRAGDVVRRIAAGMV